MYVYILSDSPFSSLHVRQTPPLFGKSPPTVSTVE